MVNSQLSNGASEQKTSAVAGLLYGDSSHGVHIPNPDNIFKSLIEQIKKSIDKIRNSENGDEDIAKVKTSISNIRETLEVSYKSGLIKENDLNLAEKIIDELEVSLSK